MANVTYGSQTGDVAGGLNGVESSRSREIALRKKTERTLRALSHIARAMALAVDESTYLEEVCKIVIDDCGPSLVWIGFAEEDESKTIRPIAHAGFEHGYLETLHLTWANTDRGRGPAGTSIRTKRVITCRNILTDRRFTPWRHEAMKRGYSSMIALPLIAGDKAFGIMAIYSAEPDAFSQDEQQLLTELANDVAQGIAAIRLRSAQVRTFLATLSHELRNPLAPIRNSVHLLRLAPAGGEQATRALSIIERQVDHMTRLIDDLLDVTRISQGKIALRREPIDLRELLLEAVEDNAPIFAQQGIELTLTPCEKLRVYGDRTRLAQVVGNLLQNAAKFTLRGGQTSIDLRRPGRAAEAVIRVRDTGVGIAADMLAHVFEPFVQAHGEEHSQRGLGLGLAVVKGLVEMHGGSVFVSSQGRGRGAEFTIRLPMGESAHLRPDCT